MARATEAMADYFHETLLRIAQVHPPREDLDLRQLAFTVCCIIDGGIVVDKGMGGAGILPAQLRMLCTHIRLVFEAPQKGRTLHQRPALAVA